MIAVEQFGQNPFRWTYGLSEIPCPIIDRPFHAIIEDFWVRSYISDGRFSVDSAETYVDDYRCHNSDIQQEDIPIFFKIINFAISGEEFHPDYEEFKLFFDKYDVVRFIP